MQRLRNAGLGISFPIRTRALYNAKRRRRRPSPSGHAGSVRRFAVAVITGSREATPAGRTGGRMPLEDVELDPAPGPRAGRFRSAFGGATSTTGSRWSWSHETQAAPAGWSASRCSTPLSRLALHDSVRAAWPAEVLRAPRTMNKLQDFVICRPRSAPLPEHRGHTQAARVSDGLVDAGRALGSAASPFLSCYGCCVPCRRPRFVQMLHVSQASLVGVEVRASP